MGVQDVEEKDVEKPLGPRTPYESSDDIREASYTSTDEPTSSSCTKTPEEQQQRASSVSSETRGPIPVPRSERRGWLARMTIIAEVKEPKDYSRRTKWFITFIVALAAAAAPMGSAIVLRTTPHPFANLAPR